MKKLQSLFVSIYGSMLVFLIASLSELPLLPADFLPALLPLLIDLDLSGRFRWLGLSGSLLLTAETALIWAFPAVGVWMPGVNAVFLCCIVLLDALFSYSLCWKDALYSRRGKTSRVVAEAQTRSFLLAAIAFVAVCPICLGMERSVVGPGYRIWALVSGLLLSFILGWALLGRGRSRRPMFSRERIRSEFRALQEKETEIRKVRTPSQSAEDLYFRAVDMMRSKRLFLLYEFTLYDMAQRLFTNRLYLSRTINTMSGRGFRSFVNFFRIQYSIRLFKKTPTMKVHALAELSGFHSQVTYTTAFKLEMGMTPGEYFMRLVQGDEVPECPEYPSMIPEQALPTSAPSSEQDGSK